MSIFAGKEADVCQRGRSAGRYIYIFMCVCVCVCVCVYPCVRVCECLGQEDLDHISRTQLRSSLLTPDVARKI
jgi:hypothetical protein